MDSSFNEKDFDSYVKDIQDFPLDNFTIEMVARHLTRWEDLARLLHLMDAEMEEIKHDYPKYKEQKCKAIACWVKKNGKDGTIINLLRHVYFYLNDKHLVMKVVEEIQQCSSRSVTEEDLQQILVKEDIHDVLLMDNIPLLQGVAFLLQNWKSLARYLKLDEPTITQIQEDNKDFNEQKFQCLYKWVQLKGDGATLMNLLRVFYFCLKDKLIIHQVAQCQREDKENCNKLNMSVKLQSPMNNQSPCTKCSKT